MFKLFSFLSFLLLFGTNSLNAQLLSLNELSEKDVFTLEEALLNPEQVYKLNLKRHKLSQFPDLNLFPNLQWINLSRNRMTEIPAEIFLLKNLQYLDLSKNKIDLIPKEIGNLTSLKQLYLNQNNIASLPPQIGKLINLELFDLWENEISVLPIEIAELKKLKTLDLRNILINDDEQKKISLLLPDTKIYFSPGCLCKY
ncbi:MAG: leucine-rich repeat domain-containing protein [Bacteroidota bacterium]|nr:leucine-rich repeat domain-containing protein [Bacteroidota bacterium]